MPASDGAFAKITSSMRIPASRKTIVTKDRTPAGYFSFSYSALACLRMGMSGSASFQRRNSGSVRQADAADQVSKPRIGSERIQFHDEFQFEGNRVPTISLVQKGDAPVAIT
jgi:hypothetical protein